MKQAIFEKIEQIFREVFEDDELELSMELTADHIAMWDSLTHLSLVTEIESRFNITISFVELMSFKNVGDLVNCVEKLTTANSK